MVNSYGYSKVPLIAKRLQSQVKLATRI